MPSLTVDLQHLDDVRITATLFEERARPWLVLKLVHDDDIRISLYAESPEALQRLADAATEAAGVLRAAQEPGQVAAEPTDRMLTHDDELRGEAVTA